MSAHRAGGRRRPLRRLAAAVTALLTVPLLSVVVAGQAQAQAPGASSPTASTAGAPVPFVEQNAALDATTDGSVLAPNYYYGTLASEATGRTAVRLAGQGQYVQFTLTAPANAVDFHYAIPDSSDGSGLTDPLSMYVDGDFDAALSLTSKYSWLYGAYQFSNTPTVGEPDNNVPHDFYDDVRAMFPSVLPVGTTVRLQIDSGDNAPWYVINTADFENVAAPIAQPAGSIDVTQAPYDVDPTGARDSTQGLVNAISAAETAGTGVYLPEGTYQINQPIGLNKVAVRGAGEWYTTLTGSNVGFYGNVGQTTGVTVSDLSIFGQTDHRDDSDGTVNGFNGGFNDTTISHVWIQNTKCGAWIVGATTNLTLDAVRIQDTMADGVNFDGAVTGSTVRNSFLRNTQDDGLAMWSTQADSGDSFTQNTVDSPGLANNIAIYGGHDNSVTGNLVQDTVTRGGGIHVGNRFGATALAGTTTISGNKLLRTGQFDPGWSYGVGAIWFWALDSAMTGAIDVTGNEIDSSPYEAFQFQSSGGNGITDVTISDDTVDGVGTYVFQNQAKGSVSVSGVTATGVGVAGVQDCASGMVLDQGAGNSGWSSTTCGFPATGALWAFPNVLTFQNGAVGTATATQQVSIMNTGDAAATLGSITASSGFTVKPDPNKPCGSSLAATAPAADGPWCQVDVSFTAPAAGVTNGTLTIPSSEPGSPTTVALVGTSGTGGTVNHPLTATPGSLTFGSLPVGTTSAAQTVTVANPSTTPVAIGSVGVTGPYAQTDNCPSSLPANGSCTVTVRFTPTAGGPQNGSVTIANSSTAFPLTVGLSGIGVSATTNLAGGAPITASSTSGGFPATNADDGDTSSYWESANNAFPQWLRVDLGSAQSVGSVVLDLPPSSAWGARTQTLSVLDSVDGSSWSTLKASAGYTFDPATGNTVTIALPSGTTARYVEVSVTANTAWPAAQISEFQVFSGGGGGGTTNSATLAASPSSLAFGNQTQGSTSAARTVTVTNSGTASAAISSVTSTGDFAQTTTCGTTLAGGASCVVSVTYRPVVTGAETGTLTVHSNATNAALTVALTGTGVSSGGGGGTTNLALNKPVTASGVAQDYVAANADDGNTSSYWESANNAFPQWLRVDLGSAQSVGSVVLDLPPSSAWGARTQTLSVLDSVDGSSWSTLKASAGYTFDPATGNTVTIALPSGTTARYVEVSVTANTAWPAAQISEFQVF